MGYITDSKMDLIKVRVNELKIKEGSFDKILDDYVEILLSNSNEVKLATDEQKIQFANNIMEILNSYIDKLKRS
jgi:hypothetical protein